MPNFSLKNIPKDGIVEAEIGYPILDRNPQGKPLPYQIKFHNSKRKYRLMSGGFGTGGTTALVIEIAYQLLQYPNNTGLLGRLDSVELEATTLVELLNILPEQVIQRHDKYHRVIYFWNGSKLIYTGLDDSKKAVDKIKSMNLGFACIDQLEEIDESIFLALRGRLRRQNSERCFFAKCNPEGHNWAWKNWVELPLDDYLLSEKIRPAVARKTLTLINQAKLDQKTLLMVMPAIMKTTGLTEKQIMTIYDKNQYEYFGAVTLDNIYLPIEYVNDLLQYPDRWLKRYFYNSWDDFEGLVYSEFDAEKNIETAYVPEAGDNHLHGYDYGYRNPACILYGAVDYDGVLHIYDEFYQSETLIRDQAKEYKKNKYWKSAVKLADPSIKRAERDGGSVFDTWNNDHDIWWEDANNDVRQGIDRVNEYLKDGKIKISKRCVNLRAEILDYKWKRLKIGEIRNEYEEPVKQRDHTCDTLRYIINHIYKPHKASHTPPARPFVDELYGDGGDGGEYDETSL